MLRASLVQSVCLAAALCGSTVFAQGGLRELYGEGVHRYFAGDLFGAEEMFNRVIAGGSQDPRAYYFRGLIQESRGGGGEADFEEGARLEAAGRTSVPVGQSLMRIQGTVRGRIEKARRDARVMYQQQQMEMMRTAPPADDLPAAPGEAVEPSTEDVPFSEGLRSDATTEDTAQPTEPEIDATTDPFGDDAAPMTETAPSTDSTPAGSDPFGGSDASDPFGGSGADTTPATDDPFGADSGATPPADASAPTDDPFGGSGSTSGEATSDPFGGSDPFGT